MDIKLYSKFDFMKVKAFVDWDVEDGDECPDSELTFEFSVKELVDKAHCLDTSELDWEFDIDAFEEWFGNYLSDYTGFCHNEFSYHYSPILKKN